MALDSGSAPKRSGAFGLDRNDNVLGCALDGIPKEFLS
jgi:hypothetical protein